MSPRGCDAFEDLVMDLARGAVRDAAQRERALTHAEACRWCAARLDSERALSAALDMLAAGTESETPGSPLEGKLRSAFQAQVARATRDAAGEWGRPSSWAWKGLAAAAVAASVITALAVARAPRAPLGDEARRGSEAATGIEDAASDADFVPLRYAESLSDLDSVQVVRVELRRSALVNLGWPESDEGDGTVRADVLVGHDGVARAIRFVE